MRLVNFFISSAMLAIISPVAAQAQASAANTSQDSSSADNVEDGSEIIVTARQRNERLIDVPVAVSAFGQADLERYGASNLADIAEMAPQVRIAKQASGSGSSFAIRGIGSSTLDTGFDQSVSINIDGVQTSRGRSLQQSYFDIGQVEILKGPQALFFGKNSPAGVISLTSANPTDRLSAGGTVGYEFRGHEVTANGFVSAPITSTLGIRAAFQANRSRGWMENPAASGPQNSDAATGLPLRASDRWGPKERSIMGRVTLAWKPSDSFDMNLKVNAGVSKDNGEGSNGEIVFCGGSKIGGQDDPYQDCKGNWKNPNANLPIELTKGYINPFIPLTHVSRYAIQSA